MVRGVCQAVVAAMALGLAGCVNETVEERTVTVLPDGAGRLEYLTSISSTNTARVAERLLELTAPETAEGLVDLGYEDVRFTTSQDKGERAVVRTSAAFRDWSALPRFLFGEDIEYVLECGQRDGELLFGVWLPGVDLSEEHEPSHFLAIKTGEAKILESNCDFHDPATGAMHWTDATVARAGIRFRLALPAGEPHGEW
jgi:hypothetical protein